MIEKNMEKRNATILGHGVGQPLEYYKTLGSQGPGAFGLALEHSLSG